MNLIFCENYIKSISYININLNRVNNLLPTNTIQPAINNNTLDFEGFLLTYLILSQ